MIKEFSNIKTIIKQGIFLPCFSFDGVKCYRYHSLKSTNSTAKQFVKNGMIENQAVIISNEQKAGRGRYDRDFVSKKFKGLYFTFIQKVNADMSVGKVSCYSALAVCKMLKDLGINNTAIKWPNDVKVNGKKICGILPENIIYKNQHYLIIGIGVNLNYDFEDFEEVKDIATSVKIETEKVVNIFDSAKILARYLNEIFTILGAKTRFKNNIENFDIQNSDLMLEYKDKLENIGQKIKFGSSFERFGEVVDIDNEFALVIEENGKCITLNWGEITKQK